MDLEDVKVGHTYKVSASDCCVPTIEFTSTLVEIVTDGEGEYVDRRARFANGVEVDQLDRYAGGVEVEEVVEAADVACEFATSEEPSTA
jgi:hypothetical protein